MTHKFVYVHTIGCQMNVNDSDRIKSGLQSLHYRPALSMEAADLIILNTCAIREKAQQKAYSFLGRTARLKRKNPDLIVGVGGCVAQQEGENILKQMPYLDFVFGTHAIGRLAGIVHRIQTDRCRIVDTDLTDAIDEPMADTIPEADDSPTRFVTIMRGCDNFCSYCVVPYVRGRETSRHPRHILQEIQSLVADGVREVTLLGQNVNSYGQKEGLPSFAELLSEVNAVSGLLRIRFTTSHPKDLSESLMAAFGSLQKLCGHVHLPVQSGSDRILKRMNRKYTRKEYLLKVNRLRQVCPDIAITSDIIVGFPGETDADFQKTLEIIRQAEFDNIFAFSYSDRPSAPAAELTGKVSEKQKNRRLQTVLAQQEAITLRKNQALVGSTVEILVDGFSKKQNGKNGSGDPGTVQWTGRTTTHKVVNFVQTADGVAVRQNHTGRLLNVRIEKALPHSLWGHVIGLGSDFQGLKGEKRYVA
ncbi:MAG: tRNA (N6-isopentenyl adenosine(37)-C2)-methylthiotransferase MiaB [Desulfobacterales bacterium]|nr:tRNA (N6-isopentenyl adenosine(37)-C2)-methylthiotransferase MiaB [Desulfobacterales bacterium]